MRLFLPMHDLTGISFGVQALSWCASFAEPGERAARLLGAAQAVWRTSGAKVDETTAYSVFDQRSTDALRAAGAGVFETTSFEQAFAEVRRTRSTRPSPSRSVRTTTRMPRRPRPGTRAGAAGGLTRREREVAGLLAEGLSNKDIAGRLVISQRTVETHVDHVLGKLGLTSRGQVASWVAAQGR